MNLKKWKRALKNALKMSKSQNSSNNSLLEYRFLNAINYYELSLTPFSIDINIYNKNQKLHMDIKRQNIIIDDFSIYYKLNKL